MNLVFKKIFNNNKKIIVNDIYLFDSDEAGDQFAEEEIKSFSKEGHFFRAWQRGNKNSDYFSEDIYKLSKKVASLKRPYVEIACGPNMGLTPVINSINNKIPALVTDACSKLIIEWKCFLDENKISNNISFAALDAANIPIIDNSVDIVAGNIALGSIRYSGEDGMAVINEIYRILKPGGYFFALEYEFCDMEMVKRVFEIWNQRCWYQDTAIIGTFTDRFVKKGFEICEKQIRGYHQVNADDNEFGKVAADYGLKVVMKHTLYVLRKPNF